MQIARAQGLQRNFADANETLFKVQSVLPPGAARPRIRYLLERGRVFNSSGQKPEASARFLEAWQLARQAEEDFFAIDAAHMLAISAPAAEQANWNLHAIAAAEQSTQPRARNWLGSLYNNLGCPRHDRGDYAQALDLFQRAVRFRETQGKPAEILMPAGAWPAACAPWAAPRKPLLSSNPWPPRMPLPALRMAMWSKSLANVCLS